MIYVSVTTACRSSLLANQAQPYCVDLTGLNGTLASSAGRRSPGIPESANSQLQNKVESSSNDTNIAETTVSGQIHDLNVSRLLTFIICISTSNKEVHRKLSKDLVSYAAKDLARHFASMI